MEKVTGIGGVFFRAKDPVRLAAWYRDHLGIALTPNSYEEEPWRQDAGWTVFQPSSEEAWTNSKEWMLNFRVRDLDALAEQLREAGIIVKIDPEVYPNGRFARIEDPEGNPIELWEPLGEGAR